jgi:AraC-like DNA-binding protein
MNLKKRRISHSLEHNRTVGKACLQYIHSCCCQIARNLEPTFRRNPVQHISERVGWHTQDHFRIQVRCEKLLGGGFIAILDTLQKIKFFAG